MPLHRSSRRTGLSLVELLLLLAIAVVLLGLLVPAVMVVHREEARTKTNQHLHNLVAAAHKGLETYKGFPPYFGFYPPQRANPPPNVQKTVQSLFVHLLPYLDGGGTIYNSFTAEGFPPTVKGVTPPAFQPYLCPLDPTTTDGTNGLEGVTTYLANRHAFTTSVTHPQWSTYTRYRSVGFGSGTANVVFFATAVGVPAGQTEHIWTDATAWFADANGNTVPARLPADLAKATAQRPYQLTPQGSQVGMGDGSTRAYAPTVAAHVWAAACIPPPEPRGDWDQ